VKSSAVREGNDPTGPTLEGLEEFYDVDSIPGKELPGNSQGTAQTSDNFLGIAQWLTVEEAAKRLEISSNAVIKRLGKGKLAGRKVPGQFGEKWMVDPAGIPQEIHVQIAEEQPRQPQEEPGSSQGTANPGEAQPSQNEGIAQKSFDVLADVIRQQTEQIKLQNEMIRYLAGQVEAKDGEIKLLTDNQKKPGRWSGFWKWFTGR